MTTKRRKLLTRAEVEARVSLSRTTIYRLMDAGEFPTPIRVGRRAVRWPENEIDEWEDSRPPARAPRHNGDAPPSGGGSDATEPESEADSEPDRDE